MFLYDEASSKVFECLKENLESTLMIISPIGLSHLRRYDMQVVLL